jgi:uncharacterized Zn-binding protein involved in type VI secretion
MSITSHVFHAISVTASGSVTQRRLVTFAGAQATTKGEKVLGVSEFDTANLTQATVNIGGIVLVTTGAAVSKGDSLITDTQGRAIPATGNLGVGAGATPVTSTAANGALLIGADLPEFVFGDAMESASGAGSTIQVLLRR